MLASWDWKVQTPACNIYIHHIVNNDTQNIKYQDMILNNSKANVFNVNSNTVSKEICLIIQTITWMRSAL